MHPYSRHHISTIFLHWFTVILLVVAFSCVIVREFIDNDEIRKSLLMLHKSLGVLLLALVIIRLLMRYLYFVSHVHSNIPRILRQLAKLAHFSIYTFMLIVPLSGVFFTNAAGKPIVFFGLIELPKIISKNRDLADQLGDFHKAIAWIFLLLIVLHIGAALWHHFFRKDQVLLSILPSKLAK